MNSGLIYVRYVLCSKGGMRTPASTSQWDRALGEARSVVVLVDGDQAIPRLVDAFGPHLIIVKGMAELRSAMDGNAVALVILCVAAPTVTPDLMSALVSARELGNVPLAVYADPRRLGLRDALCLGRAGVDYLLLRGVDDSPGNLRRIAGECDLAEIVAAVTASGMPTLTEGLRGVVRLLLDEIRKPPAAATVAQRIGISRRALTKRAHADGFRGVRDMIMHCRVLVAIGLLEKGRTLESTALCLGFASAGHLATVLKRHTGEHLARMREAGALTYWVDCLLCPESKAHSTTVGARIS